MLETSEMVSWFGLSHPYNIMYSDWVLALSSEMVTWVARKRVLLKLANMEVLDKKKMAYDVPQGINQWHRISFPSYLFSNDRVETMGAGPGPIQAHPIWAQRSIADWCVSVSQVWGIGEVG